MKNLSEHNRDPTSKLSCTLYDAESGSRTRAKLVGGKLSHHYATTALRLTPLAVSKKKKNKQRSVCVRKTMVYHINQAKAMALNRLT